MNVSSQPPTLLSIGWDGTPSPLNPLWDNWQSLDYSFCSCSRVSIIRFFYISYEVGKEGTDLKKEKVFWVDLIGEPSVFKIRMSTNSSPSFSLKKDLSLWTDSRDRLETGVGVSPRSPYRRFKSYRWLFVTLYSEYIVQRLLVETLFTVYSRKFGRSSHVHETLVVRVRCLRKA